MALTTQRPTKQLAQAVNDTTELVRNARLRLAQLRKVRAAQGLTPEQEALWKQTLRELGEAENLL